MHRLKQRLRSLPWIAPLFQWLWDLFTLSRFKRDHHRMIVRLEQEKSGLHKHCIALQNRIDTLEHNHATLRDRTDILEHNHALLKESLESMVEKLVAQQIYYQSLALQQRIDQLGFDANLLPKDLSSI